MSLGLAFLSGLLAFLGLPGLGAEPLAFVAWVPLLLAIEGAKPRAAFGWALLSGFVVMALGSAFFLRFLVKESGFGDVPSVVLFAGLVAFEGLRPAIAAYLAARAAKKGWSMPLVFLLAYAGVEALFPMPFPWNYGASLIRFLPFAQTAELGGPVALSFVAIAGNLAVFSMVRKKPNFTSAFLWACVPFVAFAFGSARLRSLRGGLARADKHLVGVVQTNRGPHDPPTLAGSIQRAKGLVDAGAEWVVLPETALEGVNSPESARAASDLLATEVGAPAVVGALIREPDGRLFNAAIYSDPEDQSFVRYDKQKLIPFGESVPLPDVLRGLSKFSTRSGHFAPGKPRQPGTIAHQATLGVDICFEDTLAEATRVRVERDRPDVLVNLSNDGWFIGTFEPKLHFALSRLRAIEHRRYLVRSTNAGVSAVVDPTGAIVRDLPAGSEGQILAEISAGDSSTVYEDAGDGPFVGMLAMAACFAVLQRPSKKRSASEARRLPSR